MTEQGGGIHGDGDRVLRAEPPGRGAGAQVRRVRETRGRSLRSLAAQLRVSPATLSAIERGRAPLTVERLHRIAELLDTSASRLLVAEDRIAREIPPAPVGSWRDHSTIRLDPIMSAAARVFVFHGFSAASMREVAAEAEMSVAGVYHHYPSKQALLVGILDVTMAELLWRTAAARDEAGSLLESFSAMVEALALFHAVQADLAFLGASEMRALEEPHHRRITALRNQVQYALDHQAELCCDAAEFSSSDPKTACRAISTMCTALPSWFHLDGDMTAEEVAVKYAEYAVRMLR